jgi:hypothetical protein
MKCLKLGSLVLLLLNLLNLLLLLLLQQLLLLQLLLLQFLLPKLHNKVPKTTAQNVHLHRLTAQPPNSLHPTIEQALDTKT